MHIQTLLRSSLYPSLCFTFKTTQRILFKFGNWGSTLKVAGKFYFATYHLDITSSVIKFSEFGSSYNTLVRVGWIILSPRMTPSLFITSGNSWDKICLSNGFRRWCITLRFTGFLDFFHRPVFYKIENTTFRRMDLFPSEMSCFLLSGIPDDGKGPKNRVIPKYVLFQREHTVRETDYLYLEFFTGCQGQFTSTPEAWSPSTHFHLMPFKNGGTVPPAPHTS
jgi:hypothetical protein